MNNNSKKKLNFPLVIILAAAVLLAIPIIMKLLPGRRALTEKSDKYFVGFDYSSYDLCGMSPTVICKIRYDKKLEASFSKAENIIRSEEPLLFDLSDEQYLNIVGGIDLFALYNLNAEPSNPDDISDGGSSWLYIYGDDNTILKSIGGFAPTSKKYNEYRRVLFDNLPERFIEYYKSSFGA